MENAKSFIVDVIRSGYNPETYDEITISGTFSIKSIDLESAYKLADEIMRGPSIMEPMQTIDPRIDWEQEMPEGYSYIDFSFEIENVVVDEYLLNNKL